MQDVEIRLIAPNQAAVKSIREVATESQKLYTANEKGQKRQIGLIADVEKELAKLQDAQKNAMTIEHIEKYNRKIAEAKQSLEEYEKAGLKVEKTGNSMMQSVGKWALGFVSVTAALTAFKEILNSTDSLSEKFKSTLNGWKEGFASMARAIANNDFENFFKNVKAAVTEGQRYATMEERIADNARAMKIRIKENETELIKLREIQNDATKSNKIRLESGLEAERLIKEDAQDRLKLAEMIYENEVKNASFVSGQNEQTIRNFLKQEPVLMKQIEIGLKYNELISEKNRLANEGSGSGYNLMDVQAIALVQEKIDALGAEAVAYSELATGLNNIIDIQKDKLVVDLDEIEAAKQSAINLRVSSRADAMKKQSTKELIDINKEYIEDLVLMNQWTEQYFDKEKKRNKENADEEKKNADDKWNFEVEVGKKLFEQNKKQVERDIELLKERKKAEEELLKMRKEALLSMGESVNDYISIVNDLIQNEVERTQRERELLDTRISETQSSLETEIELHKAGYASNIEAKQKELDALKVQRDKALADEEKARKKQHTIEVASLVAQKAVDIAKIISSTAVANAKAVALSPLTFGQPWVAINTAAAALGIAAAAAAVIAASTAKYAKGGWTGEGKYKDSTGEKMAGIVHEREFVVRRGPAHKFRGVLEAINRDDRMMVMKSFNKIMPEASNILIENNGPNSRLDKLISENQKLNLKLSREEIIIMNGMTIYKKGNSVRVIKK